MLSVGIGVKNQEKWSGQENFYVTLWKPETYMEKIKPTSFVLFSFRPEAFDDFIFAFHTKRKILNKIVPTPMPRGDVVSSSLK